VSDRVCSDRRGLRRDDWRRSPPCRCQL
jgi:hypothetical protein